MEVILEKTIEKLGIVGEVVTVKDGYARNFLLPKKLAVKATKHNKEIANNRLKRVREEELKLKEAADSLAAQLLDIELEVQMKAQEDGKLFGSVGENEIISALKDKGYELEKKCVVLKEHFKFLGEYSAKLKLHPMVHIELKVNVIREAEATE